MSGTVVNLFEAPPEPEILHYVDAEGAVVGVGCTEWDFRIQKDGNYVALVDNQNDEPFGIVDKELFTDVLIHWLRNDQPSLFSEEDESN